MISKKKSVLTLPKMQDVSLGLELGWPRGSEAVRRMVAGATPRARAWARARARATACFVRANGELRECWRRVLTKNEDLLLSGRMGNFPSKLKGECSCLYLSHCGSRCMRLIPALAYQSHKPIGSSPKLHHSQPQIMKYLNKPVVIL